MKLKRLTLLFGLLFQLWFLTPSMASDHQKKLPNEAAINFATDWGISVHLDDNSEYGYQMSGEVGEAHNYYVNSSRGKNQQLFYSQGIFKNEEDYLFYLNELLGKIFSGPSPIITLKLNYKDGITEAAWKAILTKITEHPEKKVLIFTSTYLYGHASFEEATAIKLQKMKDIIPSNVLFLPTKGTEKFAKSDEEFKVNWVQQIRETQKASYEKFLAYQEESERQESLARQRQAELEEKFRAERPGRLKEIYEQKSEKLNKRLETTKDIPLSRDEEYMLEYLIPHEGMQLSPEAKSVNWGEVKNYVSVSLPPVPNFYLKGDKADPEKIILTLNKIYKNLSSEDTQFKSGFSSFINKINSPYNLSKDPAKSNKILEYLALTADWLTVNSQDQERIVALLSELFEQFNRCEDARVEVLSNFVRGFYQNAQTKEFFSEQLKDLIAQAKVDLSKQVFTLTQKSSRNVALAIHKKIRDEKEKVLAHEKYLYGLYMGLSIEKQYKKQNPDDKLVLKSDVYSQCPIDVGDVMSSRFESPAVIQTLNNAIADSVGLPQIPKVAFFEGRAPKIWKGGEVEGEKESYTSSEGINVKRTEIVFKNYFDAKYLINLVNEHLQTLGLKEIIDLTTDPVQKNSLKAQYPLSLATFMNDPKLKSHVSEVYEPVDYHLVTKSLVVNIDAKPIELSPGDLLHFSLVTQEMVESGQVSKETEEMYDFKADAAERILIILGIISPSQGEAPQGPNKILVPFIRNQATLLSGTMLVHAFDDDGAILQSLLDRGKLDYNEIDNNPFSIDFPERNTLHFSWWQLVDSHNKGSWEERKYALLDVADSFKGSLFGTKRDDTMAVGGHSCSEQAILLVPEGEKLVSNRFPGKIIPYSGSLREAVAQISGKINPQISLNSDSTIKSLKKSGMIVADLPIDHDGSIFDNLEKLYAFKSNLLSPDFILQQTHDLIHPKVTEIKVLIDQLEDLKAKLPKAGVYIDHLRSRLENLCIIIEYKRVNPTATLEEQAISEILNAARSQKMTIDGKSYDQFEMLNYLINQNDIINMFRKNLGKIG